jgi:hypothetical protein
MQEIEPDEHQLQIERGGTISLTVAHHQDELRQQLLMAIGISTAFSGELVHIDGWLPGLILKVRALKSVNHGDQFSIENIWLSMHARLAAWIDAPSDADALDLSFDGAHCVLIPDVFTWHILPVAYTLKCVAFSLSTEAVKVRHIQRSNSSKTAASDAGRAFSDGLQALPHEVC